jgi:hypothetical protein
MAALPEEDIAEERGQVVGYHNGAYMVVIDEKYRGPGDKDGLVEVPEEQLRLVARDNGSF